MTSPPQADQAAAVAAITVYTQQTQALRANLAAYIARLWKSLADYRSPKNFVQQVVPVVTGAQQQMSALTAAYLAQQRQIAIGGPGLPVAVSDKDVTGSATRNGTSLQDVYERPFHTVWRDLAEQPHVPGAVDDAIQAGLEQAVNEAKTDLQRSKTLTSQRTIRDERNIAGYSRILEGTYSCGLCIVASTQRYHKADLLPCHPGCDCSVAPIYGLDDPGLVINEQQLGDIHDAITAQFGKENAGARFIDGQVKINGQPLQYRDVLVTHEHSELGPIMGVRGQHFLGPSDLQ